MKNEVRTPNVIKILLTVAFISMVTIIFVQQMKVPFMLEDLYYANNLVTGEPLASFSDITMSIGCMYYWKGGSLIAGFFLQLILMAGGYVADVVNLLMMIGCAYLLFAQSRASHQRIFFSVYSFLLMIALNADWNNTYFRQFGAVNFFYPSILMLVVLNILSAMVDDPEKYKDLGIGRIAALSVTGLVAGAWAPSYGIICACALGGVILQRSHIQNNHKNGGLTLALFFTVIGVILYMACPGNYMEGSVMLTKYIGADVYPSVVLALLVLAIYLKMGGKLKPSQYLLCGVMMISVALSLFCVLILPIAPNAVLLCTMLLGISTFVSLFNSLNKIVERYRIYAYVLFVIALLYDVFVILESQLGVE